MSMHTGETRESFTTTWHCTDEGCASCSGDEKNRQAQGSRTQPDPMCSMEGRTTEKGFLNDSDGRVSDGLESHRDGGKDVRKTMHLLVSTHISIFDCWPRLVTTSHLDVLSNSE